MSFSPQRSHDEAAADVGTIEYPPGSNCQGYSQWQYGVRCPSGGWCASAVSKWAYDGGFRWGTDATCGDKGFYNTDSMVAWARRHGLLRDPRTYRAHRGDLAVFDWDGNGSTDHVEQVDYDDGWRMTLIGGNTSDAVMWRVRDKANCVAIVALTLSLQVERPPAPEVLEALAKLDHLKKHVARAPIVYGDHGADIQFFNELGVRAGLRSPVVDMSHYRDGTRDLVWHIKHIMRQKGLLASNEKSGRKFGVRVVDWLVSHQ